MIVATQPLNILFQVVIIINMYIQASSYRYSSKLIHQSLRVFSYPSNNRLYLSNDWSRLYYSTFIHSKTLLNSIQSVGHSQPHDRSDPILTNSLTKPSNRILRYDEGVSKSYCHHARMDTRLFSSVKDAIPDELSESTTEAEINVKEMLRQLRHSMKMKSKGVSDPTEKPIEKIAESKPKPIVSNNGFSLLGLQGKVIDALDSLNFVNPTPVQRAIIPRLLGDESIVVASSTGSGKTLAFLLPVIQKLIQQEASGYTRKISRPRVLILTPTRELAEQILSVVKDLSHHVKLSSCALLGGESYTIQKKELDRLVDIVVGSPGRLLQHKLQENLFLSHVSHVVIDEVDTMFTQGFGPDIRGILRAVVSNKYASQGTPTQLIFATATLTKSVKALMQELSGVKGDDSVAVFDVDFPDPENVEARRLKMDKNDLSKETIDKKIAMSIVHVDGVHRGLSNIKYNYLELEGNKDKIDLLKVSLPSTSPKSNAPLKTMVFCNTVSSCRAVHHALLEYYGHSEERIDEEDKPSSNSVLTSQEGRSVRIYSYHGEMASQLRKEHLDEFRKGEHVNSKGLPAPAVLVCTDIAARGIDIPDVDHVVLFDFPLNPVDFLHRSGRCGRMGRKATVTSLLTKRDLVLADAIKGAMTRGMALDELSSAKRDYQDRGKLAAVVGKITRQEALERERASSASLTNNYSGSSKAKLRGIRTGRRARGVTKKPSIMPSKGGKPKFYEAKPSKKEGEFVGRGVGRVKKTGKKPINRGRSSSESKTRSQFSRSSSYDRSARSARSGSGKKSSVSRQKASSSSG